MTGDGGVGVNCRDEHWGLSGQTMNEAKRADAITELLQSELKNRVMIY